MQNHHREKERQNESSHLFRQTLPLRLTWNVSTAFNSTKQIAILTNAKSICEQRVADSPKCLVKDILINILLLTTGRCLNCLHTLHVHTINDL